MNTGPTSIRLFADSPSDTLAHRTLIALAHGALERLLGVDKIDAVYRESLQPRGEKPFNDRVLQALDVRVDLHPENLRRVPRSGPLVVVANHP